jgi:ankyrin repeat protein
MLLLLVAVTGSAQQRTPLHWAARNGYVEVARGLIRNGADVDVAGTLQRTPLHFAVEHEEMVRYLVSAGAAVNATDALGNTPLHLAVRRHGAVTTLLELGADVSARNNLGDTALEIAVRHGNSRRNRRVVNALVDAGATNEIQ